MYKTIIDIGTNSLKAFVFDVSTKAPKNIKTIKEKNRLGNYLLENNTISEEGIKITIDKIKALKFEIKEFENNSITTFGTEIFRRSNNNDYFSDRLFKETGIEIIVLSQEKEAEVFWKGIVNDFNWNGLIAAIDIGGGSVQFMYGSKEKLLKVYKLNTGALFLRNKFIVNEPPKETDYNKIEEFIRNEIENIDIIFPPNTPFVHGSTSVIDFFMEAKVKTEMSSLSEQHPYKIELLEVKYLYQVMRTLPSEQRRRYFPSQPEYTDGCSIGFANVLEIANKTGLTYELPSNNSLVHGLL